jgi:hypothetical protein
MILEIFLNSEGAESVNEGRMIENGEIRKTGERAGGRQLGQWGLIPQQSRSPQPQKERCHPSRPA